MFIVAQTTVAIKKILDTGGFAILQNNCPNCSACIGLPIEKQLKTIVVLNTAERARRPAVIYRTLSFGIQSAQGSRFVERILTVSETCRLQNRNVYQYLVDAMEAKLASESAPSLLPAECKSNAKAA